MLTQDRNILLICIGLFLSQLKTKETHKAFFTRKLSFAPSCHGNRFWGWKITFDSFHSNNNK